MISKLLIIQNILVMTYTISTPAKSIQSAIITANKYGPQNLQAVLDNLFTQYDTQTVVSSVIGLLSQADHFQALITNLLGDTDSVKAIQAASYYHKNGFDKIVLLSGKNFKLRLHHFYPPGQKQPMENVHDHRWDFSSSILFGDMGMKIYKEDVNGDDLRYGYLYSPVKGGKYSPKFQDMIRVQCTENRRYAAGQHYFMPNDIMHRITDMGQQGCITLMMTGPGDRPTCKLYAAQPFVQKDCTTPRYTCTEIKDKLNGLLFKIKGGKTAA